MSRAPRLCAGAVCALSEWPIHRGAFEPRLLMGRDMGPGWGAEPWKGGLLIIVVGVSAGRGERRWAVARKRRPRHAWVSSLGRKRRGGGGGVWDGRPFAPVLDLGF